MIVNRYMLIFFQNIFIIYKQQVHINEVINIYIYREREREEWSNSCTKLNRNVQHLSQKLTTSFPKAYHKYPT